MIKFRDNIYIGGYKDVSGGGLSSDRTEREHGAARELQAQSTTIDIPSMCEEIHKQIINNMRQWLDKKPWELQYHPIESLKTLLNNIL